jgi:hypothetical protein
MTIDFLVLIKHDAMETYSEVVIELRMLISTLVGTP